MKIFNLPDLGEGLPDAEIVEWHVKEGDEVLEDAPMVSMETAKAVVDVPVPYSGKIEKLYGKPGDVIKTGAPLIAYVSTEITDSGTIAGELERSDQAAVEAIRSGTSRQQRTSNTAHATPEIRALARHLKVDLSAIQGQGIHGTITREQVIAAHESGNTPVTSSTVINTNVSHDDAAVPAGYEPLRGVRRHMAHLMAVSHSQVVPITLFDDVSIDKWSARTDITGRLLRAIVRACREEPALNAYYDTASRSRKIFSEVHLGLAMDTDDGLFVPVLKDLHKTIEANPEIARKEIQALKEEVKSRSIVPEKLKGATISLSNFGTYAGRYATPIVVPPQVAIIGAGKIRKVPLAVGNEVKIQRILPISLSMDHRAVTGGEATRFLAIMLRDLASAQ